MNTLVLWVRPPGPWALARPVSPFAPPSPPGSVAKLQGLALKPPAGQPLKGSVYFTLLLALGDIILKHLGNTRESTT